MGVAVGANGFVGGLHGSEHGRGSTDSPLSSIVADLELRSYALTLRDGLGMPAEGVMSPMQVTVVGTSPDVFRVDRADGSAIDATAIFQIIMFGHPTGHWIAFRVHGLSAALAESLIYEGHPLHGGTVSKRSPFFCASKSMASTGGSARVSFRIGLRRG